MFRIQKRFAWAILFVTLGVQFLAGCEPAEPEAEEGLGVALLLLGTGTKSSSTDPEKEYDCWLTDDPESFAGYEDIKVVSASTDSAGKYSAFSDLGAIKRNSIAIMEPISPPAFEEREYIVFLTAGHQGVGWVEPLFSGYPAVVTGQRKGWSWLWSAYHPNSGMFSTCRAGLRGRLIADALANGRLPAGRTFLTGAFDNKLSWADSSSTEVATAWVNHIKSLGNPRKIKGVYMAGASMGGCLVNYLASKLNQDPDWGKVPLIVQGVDPVCPNGTGSLSPAYLTVGPHKVQNPKTDDDSYFTYKNNTGGIFADRFPNKDRLKIYNVVGGGKVVPINKSRSFSVTDSGLSGKDGVLTHAGAMGGGSGSSEWYRQFFIHACHACLGRNWHHWIVNNGSATEHDMMRFYRDSYNHLNLWGAWVNFWTGTLIPATGTYSGGIEHESPMEYTHEVVVHADKDQADFAQREVIVPIDVMAISSATYGDDFDFLDEDENPLTVLPAGFAFSGEFAPAAPDVFAVANVSGPPTLYVRKPRTQSGQTQGRFYIRILDDAGVEPDETIYLRIGDYPVLGRPRPQRQYVLTIRDHDTVPWTQETCEAAGGVWTPGGIPPCAISETQLFEPATGGGGIEPDTSGTTAEHCEENGGSWDLAHGMCVFREGPIKDNNTCAAAGGAWNQLATRCEVSPQPGHPPFTGQTCRSAAGHWFQGDEACIRLGAPLSSVTCPTLGPGAYWDQAAQQCLTTRLSITSGWCSSAGGTWDPVAGNCKLAEGRPATR